MSMTMAARAHSGASLSAPVRRAQPARRKTSWLGRVARAAGKRPGRALILLTFGIVSVAIVANALMFQKARHPAPMLSASTPASQSRTTTERRAEPAPAPSPAAEAPAQPIRPPARPTDLSQTQAAREAQPRPPAPVQAAPRAAAPAAPAAAPRAAAAPARDPIADLINGGDLRPPADVKSANRSAATPRT